MMKSTPSKSLLPHLFARVGAVLAGYRVTKRFAIAAATTAIVGQIYAQTEITVLGGDNFDQEIENGSTAFDIENGTEILVFEDAAVSSFFVEEIAELGLTNVNVRVFDDYLNRIPSSDFTLIDFVPVETAPPDGTLVPGAGGFDFSVLYTPTTQAAQPATIEIDADEFLAPYTFQIRGSVSSGFTVEGGAERVLLINGDTTFSTENGTDFDFLFATQNARSNEFRLTNNAEGGLDYTDLAITLSGGEADQFSVKITQPIPDTPPNGVNILPNGRFLLFEVKYAPTRTGTHDTTVVISAENNPDPFQFAVRGSKSNDLHDDNYKGNSTSGSAFPLPMNTLLSNIRGLGIIAQNQAFPNGPDWYRIQTPGTPADELVLSASLFYQIERESAAPGSPSEFLGDLDLIILGPNTANFTVNGGIGESQTDDEFLSFVAQGGSVYYLRVQAKTFDDKVLNNRYDLIWTAVSPSVSDDLYENTGTDPDNPLVPLENDTVYLGGASAAGLEPPIDSLLTTQRAADLSNHEQIPQTEFDTVSNSVYPLDEDFVPNWLQNLFAPVRFDNNTANLGQQSDDDWYRIAVSPPEPPDFENEQDRLDSLVEQALKALFIELEYNTSAETPGEMGIALYKLIDGQLYLFMVSNSELAIEKGIVRASDADALFSGQGRELDFREPPQITEKLPNGSVPFNNRSVISFAPSPFVGVGGVFGDSGIRYNEDGIPLVATLDTFEGNYYIRVFGDDIGNAYNLSWDDLREDRYVANDVDFDENFDLTPYQDRWLSELNGLGINQQGEVDRFKVTVTDPSTTRVIWTLNTFNVLVEGIRFGDFVIPEVLDSNFNITTGNLGVFSGPFTYVYTLTQSERADLPRDFFFAIRNFPDNDEPIEVDSIPFDLKVELDTTPQIGEGEPPDAYEPNNTFESPFDLSAHPSTWLLEIDGLATQTDNDWYRITVPEGATELEVIAQFNKSRGDIGVALYDANFFRQTLFRFDTDGDDADLDIFDDTFFDEFALENTQLFFGNLSETADGFTEIRLSNPTPGHYYIVVTGLNSGSNYNLFWSTNSDPYETEVFDNNDSIANATDLRGSRENVPLSKILGTAAQGRNTAELDPAPVDVDFYRIEVPADALLLDIQCTFTDVLTETIIVTNDEGEDEEVEVFVDDNIDMLLVDEFGFGVASSESTTSNESITIQNPDPGIYYIKIVGDNSGNVYDLVWVARTEELGPDDHLEFSGYHLHNPDDTAYTVHVGVQNDDLDFDTIEEGFVNEVLPTSATEFDDGTNQVFLSETFVRQPELYIAFGESAIPGMPPEEFDRSTFWTLGPLVQNDDDWYAINIPPGTQNLIVECFFSHAEGDIDIEVYREDTALNQNSEDPAIESDPLFVARSQSRTDGERIEVPVLGLGDPGLYYVRVFGQNNGNEYDLVWSIVGEDLYDQDPFNPTVNDNRSNAFRIPNAPLTSVGATDEIVLSEISGRGSQLDPDWYSIEFSEGVYDVTVECTFNSYFGNLNLSLFNKFGTLLATGTGTAAGEVETITLSLEGVSVLPGEGFLKVDGPDEGTVYDLTVNIELLALSPLADVNGNALPDWFEQKYSGSATGLPADSNDDGDRYTAQDEYALMLDPDSIDTEVLDETLVGDYFYVSFRWNPDAEQFGYSYDVLESATMDDFDTASSAVFISAEAQDDGSEIVTYRCSESILDVAKRFFQLRVFTPPAVP